MLTSTFFSCRIVWGLYSSYHTFTDMYTAIQAGYSQRPAFKKPLPVNLAAALDENAQIRAFMGDMYLPVWLACTYLSANITLNVLNIIWFSKMIATIRKRFDPPWGTKGIGPDHVPWEPTEKAEHARRYAAKEEARLRAEAAMPGNTKGSVTAGRKKAEAAMNGSVELDEAAQVQRGVFADGRKSVEVTGSTRRTARSRRKA